MLMDPIFLKDLSKNAGLGMRPGGTIRKCDARMALVGVSLASVQPKWCCLESRKAAMKMSTLESGSRYMHCNEDSHRTGSLFQTAPQ